MRYKSITYDITIGSYWPDKMYPSQITVPVGGKQTSITLELPERIEKDPMNYADNLLAEHMRNNYPGQTYHVWYWDWATIREDDD